MPAKVADWLFSYRLTGALDFNCLVIQNETESTHPHKTLAPQHLDQRRAKLADSLWSHMIKAVHFDSFGVYLLPVVASRRPGKEKKMK